MALCVYPALYLFVIRCFECNTNKTFVFYFGKVLDSKHVSLDIHGDLILEQS
jgi:hypothetical protein